MAVNAEFYVNLIIIGLDLDLNQKLKSAGDCREWHNRLTVLRVIRSVFGADCLTSMVVFFFFLGTRQTILARISEIFRENSKMEKLADNRLNLELISEKLIFQVFCGFLGI